MSTRRLNLRQKLWNKAYSLAEVLINSECRPSFNYDDELMMFSWWYVWICWLFVSLLCSQKASYSSDSVTFQVFSSVVYKLTLERNKTFPYSCLVINDTRLFAATADFVSVCCWISYNWCTQWRAVIICDYRQRSQGVLVSRLSKIWSLLVIIMFCLLTMACWLYFFSSSVCRLSFIKLAVNFWW